MRGRGDIGNWFDNPFAIMCSVLIEEYLGRQSLFVLFLLIVFTLFCSCPLEVRGRERGQRSSWVRWFVDWPETSKTRKGSRSWILAPSRDAAWVKLTRLTRSRSSVPSVVECKRRGNQHYRLAPQYTSSLRLCIGSLSVSKMRKWKSMEITLARETMYHMSYW